MMDASSSEASNSNDAIESTRPSKRPKRISNPMGGVSQPSLKTLQAGLAAASVGARHIAEAPIEDPTLPPEVWAMVLNHLDYASVLACAATSRAMLRDAMPLVTSLHIDTASQMDGTLVSRYSDVREINIYSLLTATDADGNVVDNEEDDVYYYSVEYDSVMRVVPFLSRFGGNLMRVFLGGKTPNGATVHFCTSDVMPDEDEDPGRAKALMDVISGAHRCRVLPSGLRVLGLRCPYSSVEDFYENASEISECEACQRACKSFPLDQVVNFRNPASSDFDDLGHENRVENINCFDTVVCLTRSQIESIVESRPGGRALLQSSYRLLHLLSRGIRYELPGSGPRIHFVMYSDCQWDEIERTIEYAGLDVKTISPDVVLDAIRGVAEYSIPSKEQCYLAYDGMKELKDMGFLINEQDFLNPLSANIDDLLPRIVKALSSGEPDIQHQFSILLSRILSEREDPPIQQVIDLGVAPKLIELLSCLRSDVRKHASIMIGEIALKGMPSHVAALVGKDAIPELIELLGSNSCNRTVHPHAARSLGRIARASATYRNAIIQAGALPPLAKLLEEARDVDTVRYVPWTLGVLFKGPFEGLSHALVEPCIGPLVKLLLLLKTEGGDDACNNDEGKCYKEMLDSACLAIHWLCQWSDETIRKLVEAGLLPRLLELLSSTEQMCGGAMTLAGCLLRKESAWNHPMISASDLSHLSAFLPSTVTVVRRLSCRAICNIISCGSKKEVRAATQIVPEIAQMLEDSITSIQMDAARALLKVSTVGSKEQMKSLISSGLIRQFCDLLAKDDPALNEVVLQSLKRILKGGRKQTNGVNVVRCEMDWIEQSLVRLESNDKLRVTLNEHIEGIRKEIKRAKSLKESKSTGSGKVVQRIIIKGKSYPM